MQPISRFILTVVTTVTISLGAQAFWWPAWVIGAIALAGMEAHDRQRASEIEYGSFWRTFSYAQPDFKRYREGLERRGYTKTSSKKHYQDQKFWDRSFDDLDTFWFFLAQPIIEGGGLDSGEFLVSFFDAHIEEHPELGPKLNPLFAGVPQEDRAEFILQRRLAKGKGNAAHYYTLTLLAKKIYQEREGHLKPVE